MARCIASSDYTFQRKVRLPHEPRVGLQLCGSVGTLFARKSMRFIIIQKHKIKLANEPWVATGWCLKRWWTANRSCIAIKPRGYDMSIKIAVLLAIDGCWRVRRVRQIWVRINERLFLSHVSLSCILWSFESDGSSPTGRRCRNNPQYAVHHVLLNTNTWTNTVNGGNQRR